MINRKTSQRLLSEALQSNQTLQQSRSTLQRNEILLTLHQDFLSEMKLNEGLGEYNFWQTCLECVAIALQFTCCCLFCLIFYIIYNIEPYGNYQDLEMTLLIANFILILPFLYIYHSKQNSTGKSSSSFVYSIFNWIIVVLILLGASPILRTLTLLYSEDTIIALVFFSFLIHLFTHDYYFVNGKSKKYNCYLSLNCVIFVSALLASRLKYSLDAFVILIISIQIFLLFPFLRFELRRESRNFTYISIFIVIVAVTGVCLFYFVQSIFLFLTFIIINTMLVFIMPYLFVLSQNNYKRVLSGPWDEAVVPPQEYERLEQYLATVSPVNIQDLNQGSE